MTKIPPTAAAVGKAKDRSLDPLNTDHLTEGLGARAARGAGIAISAQVYRVLLQLVSGAILSRLLSPEDFGIMAMAMTVTGFVGIFSDMGLHSAIVQRQKLSSEMVSGLYYITAAGGVLLFCLCAGLAPLAAMAFNDDRIFWVIVVTGATFPIAGMAATHGAIIWRQMKIFRIQSINLCTMTLSTSLSVILAWITDLGFWSFVVGTWSGTLLNLLLVRLLSGWRPVKVRDWSESLQGVRFGAYLTGFGLADYFHRQGDNILIGWKFGAADLGIYSRAYALFSLPLSSVIFPSFEIAKTVLSRSASNAEQYRRLFHAMLLPLNIISGLMTGIMYTLAPTLISFVYGEQWGRSVPLFQALSLCMCVQAITTATGWLFISSGRTREMFILQVASTVIYLVVFAFTVQVSMQAVAIGYATTSLMIVLPHLWFALRKSDISFGEYLQVHGPVPLAALGSLGLQMFLPGGSNRSDFINAAGFTLWYLATVAAVTMATPLSRDVGLRAFTSLRDWTREMALRRV